MARRGPRNQEPHEPPDAATALEIAARYLANRPRTRWEVERRLRQAGAEADVIEATLERLVEFGYVDDGAFARWWGEQRDRHSPRGRRMIEAELRQHGVPRDVIELHREHHDDPERSAADAALPATEADRAREALAKHLRGRPVPDDRKALQRLGMYLVRRGFDPDTARSAIRQAVAAGDATDELSDESD